MVVAGGGLWWVWQVWLAEVASPLARRGEFPLLWRGFVCVVVAADVACGGCRWRLWWAGGLSGFRGVAARTVVGVGCCGWGGWWLWMAGEAGGGCLTVG